MLHILIGNRPGRDHPSGRARHCSGYRLRAALAVVLLSGSLATAAQESLDSFATGDADFALTEVKAGAAGSAATDLTVLWLTSGPDSRGLYDDVAERLSERGISTVTSNILDAYLLDSSRGAMVAVPPADLVALYDEILAKRPGRLIVMAAGRVAIPVLRAVNVWQQSAPDRGRIAGTILVSPNLYLGVPELGEIGAFYPVAKVTTVPVFLIQPRLSVRAFRLREIASQLGEAGSPVFTAVVKQLRGGFFFNADELEPGAGEPMIDEFVTTAVRATKMLALQKPLDTPPPDYTSLEAPTRSNLKDGLVAVTRTVAAPPLKRPLLDGTPVDLEQYKGKLVVVNFWASWCPPCLEEIPSMVDFYKEYRAAGRELELLAVSVGETVDEVSAFLKHTPLPFPIVMDANSDSARDWRVFTYPTTLVIGPEGNIVAGAVGVVDWTAPQTRALVDGLLGAR